MPNEHVAVLAAIARPGLRPNELFRHEFTGPALDGAQAGTEVPFEGRLARIAVACLAGVAGKLAHTANITDSSQLHLRRHDTT